MHAQAYDFVRASVPPLTDADEVLEIGGQDMNGSVRGLFSPPARYLSLDCAAGPGVDLVADAADWRPLDPDRRFSVVVCCEVLEHTPDWAAIIQTAHDVLAPGGLFILTCAGPGRPVHSGRAPVWELAPGEWYQNLTVEDVADTMEKVGLLPVAAQLRGQDVQALGRRPAG